VLPGCALNSLDCPLQHDRQAVNSSNRRKNDKNNVRDESDVHTSQLVQENSYCGSSEWLEKAGRTSWYLLVDCYEERPATELSSSSSSCKFNKIKQQTNRC